MYRHIHRSAAPLFRSLTNDGVLDDLIANHGLVPTEATSLSLDGHPDGLIVHHERISPMSYCVEWCPSMLRDAGRSVIGLSLAVVEHDLVLQDAYPWNVAFRGTKPIYLDLTSIATAPRDIIWPAYEQFRSFFLRPLALAAEGKGRIARALLLDNIGGITLEEFHRAVSYEYCWRHPGLPIEYGLHRLISRRRTLRERLSRTVSAPARNRVRPDVRRQFLRRLERRLDAVPRSAAFDPWQAYYDELPDDVDADAKVDTVRRLLSRMASGSVLDLGCNTGFFSVVAAREGAQVVAVDRSEACIERLYGTACRDDLQIMPLVADAVCPTPAFGFMGRQYPDLWSRIRSETVLCLALMHHLHISARQSFERIAELLDAVAERHVIFEFVSLDDPNNRLLSKPRPIDYRLETVMDALGARFREMEVLPSDRPTRRLIVCSK